MNEEQGTDKDSIGLALLEILLERGAELFRIFYKLFLPLLHRLLAGYAWNEAHNLVDGIQQLFNGTCDLSAEVV